MRGHLGTVTHCSLKFHRWLLVVCSFAGSMEPQYLGPQPPNLEYNKIATLMSRLAGEPYDERKGRETLTSLVEMNSDVDELISKGPLSSELKQHVNVVSLRYPGLNLFWHSKHVTKISPDKFHELFPYIGCLTRSNEHEKERILRPSFLKVNIVVFLIISCVNSQQIPQLPETNFKISNEFLFVQSVLYKHEVVDFTEIFDFSVLDEMNSILQSFKKRSESFKTYKLDHAKCFNVGYSPDLIDDLTTVQQLASNRSLNNLVLNHFENYAGNTNEYVLVLRLDSRGAYECIIDYSATKASFLLSANMFRLPPAYKHNLSKYRDKMINSFEAQGTQCLSEGLLYDKKSSHSRYDYDMEISVSEPAVERCSDICSSMNIKYMYAGKINQLTSSNLSVADCQLFSYALGNATCYIKNSASRQDFRNVEKWSTFDGLAVTGSNNCISRYSKGFPQILVNDQLQDARKICIFAPKTVMFEDRLFQCLGLYNELLFPLNQLQLKLDTFVRQLKGNFGHKNMKMKRSAFGSIAGFILQNILKAAGFEGMHNIGFFPDMTKQILNVISNSLKTIGHFNKIILKNNADTILIQSNLTSIISALGNFEKIFKLDMKLNYNKILGTFRKQMDDVIRFYSELISNPNPYLNSTKIFVKDSNYLYTFSVIGNTISRQFVKTYASKFKNATSLSLIPLTIPFFNEPLFWKSAIKGGALQNENRCLIALLKTNVESYNKIRATCTGDRISRIELSKDIFVIKHQFGSIQGSLLVINKYAIIEISCLSSMLIDNCLGFCVFAVSDECQIIVNSELIRESNKIAASFAPKTILNRNSSLIMIPSVEKNMSEDEIQYVLIAFVSLGLIGILIIQISCICCNCKKKIAYGPVSNKEDIINQKEGEELNFISKQ